MIEESTGTTYRPIAIGPLFSSGESRMLSAQEDRKRRANPKPPALGAGGFVSLGWLTSIELIATSNEALS
jgi:hypothetical protein